MEIMVTMEQFIERIKNAKALIVTAENSNPISHLYIYGAHLDSYYYEKEQQYLCLDFKGNGNVRFETWEFHGIETEDFETEIHYHLFLTKGCTATIYLATALEEATQESAN